MDRQVSIDVEKVIGEVMKIDWRDKDGGWTDYIRIRVKIDALSPFEGLPILLEVRELRLSAPSSMKLGGSTQNIGNWRNGIEILEKKISSSDKNNDKKIWNGDENDFMTLKGKKVRCGEEESESRSLMEKHKTKLARDGSAE
ncbi:hypothetical protein Gogos_020584 [Gossypium gossypioides]|uniref:Uncharacterized protein n=1 Tax=Gossypium gossypioides TaxID=34282 RepID=A0A7J9CZG5_GOSGO|nr:hypothetical protein [Gossypium gossypioides]